MAFDPARRVFRTVSRIAQARQPVGAGAFGKTQGIGHQEEGGGPYQQLGLSRIGPDAVGEGAEAPGSVGELAQEIPEDGGRIPGEAEAPEGDFELFAMAPHIVLDLRGRGSREQSVGEPGAARFQFVKHALLAGDPLARVLQLVGGLLSRSLGIGGRLQGLCAKAGCGAVRPLRQQRAMQRVGQPAGGVTPQGAGLHVQGQDLPKIRPADAGGGGGQPSRPSADAAQRVALACARPAEDANGERRLDLPMHRQISQKIQRPIVPEGGRVRGVGVEQGRGRIGFYGLFEGRHNVIHAISPDWLPRRLRRPQGISQKIMSAKPPCKPAT